MFECLGPEVKFLERNKSLTSKNPKKKVNRFHVLKNAYGAKAGVGVSREGGRGWCWEGRGGVKAGGKGGSEGGCGEGGWVVGRDGGGEGEAGGRGGRGRLGGGDRSGDGYLGQVLDGGERKSHEVEVKKVKGFDARISGYQTLSSWQKRTLLNLHQEKKCVKSGVRKDTAPTKREIRFL